MQRAVWLGRSIVLGASVGLLAGAASALFLWLLERATEARIEHGAWVWALPIAGLGMGAALSRWGGAIDRGSSLVLDTAYGGGPPLPARMAPMVLAGTVVTHLVGGSAGREGAAVQAGASLADQLSRWAGVTEAERRELLVAGMAGGFGSVFGTPIAGALFGMEVVVVGRLQTRALLPALTASLVGDLVTRALGIEHTAYPELMPLTLSPSVLGRWGLFALAIAAVAIVFLELTHRLQRAAKERVPHAALRMALGGVVLVALTELLGTHDYLGLGVPTIVRAFEDPTLPAHAFALKLVFTAITLAAGFLGGEVTPLFFIGATLGNVLARLLDLPIGLGAAVGMASLFAVASNTPLALSVMAVELVGSAALPHVVIVSVLAYLLSGQRSLYRDQRAVGPKLGPSRASPRRIGEIDADGPT